MTCRLLYFVLILLKPLNRPADAFFERDLRPPAEIFIGASDVESAAGLTVGFIRLPDKFAFKAGQAGDHFYQILDRNFMSRAQVDRLVAVVLFRRGHDSISGIFYV